MTEMVSKPATRELDALFLSVFGQLNEQVMKHAEDVVSKILVISSTFLSQRALSAIQNFHALYMGNTFLNKNKYDINKDVDRLVDTVRKEMTSLPTEDIGSSITENEEVKKLRLSLAAIQKELETIIRMEQGIREKLIPVLTGMQFEDMMRHRLLHIEKMWQIVTENMNEEGCLDVNKIMPQLSRLCTSVKEKKLFYHLVVKKELSAEIDQSSEEPLLDQILKMF